jgi:hypothetical protein
MDLDEFARSNSSVQRLRVERGESARKEGKKGGGKRERAEELLLLQKAQKKPGWIESTVKF